MHSRVENLSEKMVDRLARSDSIVRSLESRYTWRTSHSKFFNKQQAKWQKGKETEGMDERRRVHTLSINRTLLPRERES